MLKLLRTGQLDEFLARAADFEPADLADVLAQLDDEKRLEVVKRLPAEVSAAALVEMPRSARRRHPRGAGSDPGGRDRR